MTELTYPKQKLVYLQQSLKDGPAKCAIEGLTRSGDDYTEAIKCLVSQYDKPRLIHQAHVRMILEAHNVKDGSGKELRRLLDTVLQHMRALKAMGHEPSGPFLTSIIELKLDTDTLFEWQKHSQDTTDMPHYQKLLEFLNLRAQASESSVQSKKLSKNPIETSFGRRATPTNKPITSFVANSTSADTSHRAHCKSDDHQRYGCTKFKALSHDQKLSTLKTNGCCLNCL